MKFVGIAIAVILVLLMLKEPRTVIQVEAAPAVLTYQQLVDYPVDCKLKDQQLAELQRIQRIKNFNPDSDELTETDYHYNSRLKATIWYYSYGCEQ